MKVLKPRFLEKSEAGWYRALVLLPMVFLAVKFWPLLPLVFARLLAWLDRTEGFVLKDGGMKVYGLRSSSLSILISDSANC